MNSKQIEKSRLALSHAGSPADHRQTLATLISWLTGDVRALSEKMAALRADYRRTLSRWRTEEVPENVAVCEIPSHRFEANVYRITAILAILAESLLAAWVFTHLGVPPVVGVLAAVLITGLLHGGLTFLFSDHERPRRAVWRLRRIVILPAVVVFLVGLAVAVLGRYVQGAIALMLLPVLAASLWALTLSLMLTAAALWTLAHLLGWSGRFEREYKKVDAEERATADFLRELGGAHPPATSNLPAITAEVVEPSRPKPDGRAARRGTFEMVLLAIVLASAASTVACASGTIYGEAAPISGVPATQIPAELDVYIDWSGSCMRPAMDEAWNTVRAALPEIAEDRHITSVTIWRFDEDGWCPERVKQVALPVFAEPATAAAPQTASEWQDFKNIREATTAAEEGQRAERLAGERAHHRAAVAPLLKALDAGDVLPPASRKSRKTDIAGLLGRIAREGGHRSAIVVSDLADTQYRHLPPFGRPEGDTEVLVLLVPAYPKDARLTIGRALAAAEQFELRRRELRLAAPWAAVVPYFAQNLSSLLQPVDKTR